MVEGHIVKENKGEPWALVLFPLYPKATGETVVTSIDSRRRVALRPLFPHFSGESTKRFEAMCQGI